MKKHLTENDNDGAILVLDEMFRHERSVDTPQVASNQGVGSLIVQGLTRTFSDLLISAQSEGEVAGTSQQSLGFTDLFSKLVSNIENTFTPWKRQGIEENEGLIEGLDNGYSPPVTDQA
ncbi:hypothetical protein L9F63_025178, partial [Diploptera punctata]